MDINVDRGSHTMITNLLLMVANSGILDGYALVSKQCQ